jgi:hypothetical protein
MNPCCKCWWAGLLVCCLFFPSKPDLYVFQEDRENLFTAAQTAAIIPDVIQNLNEVVYGGFTVKYRGMYTNHHPREREREGEGERDVEHVVQGNTRLQPINI